MKKIFFTLCISLFLIFGAYFLQASAASDRPNTWTAKSNKDDTAGILQDYFYKNNSGSIHYLTDREGEVTLTVAPYEIQMSSIEPNTFYLKIEHLEKEVAELKRLVLTQSGMIKDIHEKMSVKGRVK